MVEHRRDAIGQGSDVAQTLSGQSLRPPFKVGNDKEAQLSAQFRTLQDRTRFLHKPGDDAAFELHPLGKVPISNPIRLTSRGNQVSW